MKAGLGGQEEGAQISHLPCAQEGCQAEGSLSGLTAAGGDYPYLVIRRGRLGQGLHIAQVLTSREQWGGQSDSLQGCKERETDRAWQKACPLHQHSWGGERQDRN